MSKSVVHIRTNCYVGKKNSRGNDGPPYALTFSFAFAGTSTHEVNVNVAGKVKKKDKDHKEEARKHEEEEKKWKEAKKKNKKAYKRNKKLGQSPGKWRKNNPRPLRENRGSHFPGDGGPEIKKKLDAALDKLVSSGKLSKKNRKKISTKLAPNEDVYISLADASEVDIEQGNKKQVYTIYSDLPNLCITIKGGTTVKEKFKDLPGSYIHIDQKRRPANGRQRNASRMAPGAART